MEKYKNNLLCKLLDNSLFKNIKFIQKIKNVVIDILEEKNREFILSIDINDINQNNDFKIIFYKLEEKKDYKIFFVLDGVKVGFIKFYIDSENTLTLDFIVNTNEDLNSVYRKEFFGKFLDKTKKTNIKGLGTFMLKHLFLFANENKFKNIKIESLSNTIGFYKKNLDIFSEKFSGKYIKNDSSFEFYFN